MAKVGRPTKYKPEMCDRIKELMKEGASIAEVCADFGISKQAFYDWCNPDSNVFQPQFLDAVKEAEILSEAWWVKKGKDHLVYESGGKRLDSRIYDLHMRNRFNWNQKVDITSGGEKMEGMQVYLPQKEE